RKNLALIQLARPLRSGVVGLKDQPQVGDPFRCDSRANIALHARQQVVLDPLDNSKVVLARDLRIALLPEQLAHFQVILRADYRAPRDTRQALHVAQQIEFSQSRQDANVIESRSKSSARKRESDLTADDRTERSIGVADAAQPI